MAETHRSCFLDCFYFFLNVVILVCFLLSALYRLHHCRADQGIGASAGRHRPPCRHVVGFGSCEGECWDGLLENTLHESPKNVPPSRCRAFLIYWSRLFVVAVTGARRDVIAADAQSAFCHAESHTSSFFSSPPSFSRRVEQNVSTQPSQTQFKEQQGLKVI